MSDEAVGAIRPGALIGGYRIDRRLGQGGMAVVYRAHDDRLGRLVALKVLAEEFAEDPEFRQRFMRESRAAAAVDDPHIIPVFNAGESGDLLYIAMRYVQGGDVAKLLRQEGKLPPVRAAEIVAQVASALDAAHRHGLVHRDVKPSNMLLDTAAGEDRPDHVYLADFGLSKHALTSTRITASGQFLGTLDYVAPEQIEGLQVDGRTDQYALACAAFELLAGEPPFHRDHTIAIINAQLNQPPPPLSAHRPGLPAALDSILQRAMAKSPVERYRTCGAFAAALAAAVGARPAGVVLGPATPASPTRPVDTPVPAQLPRQGGEAAAVAPQPVIAQPAAAQPAVAQQPGGSRRPGFQRAGAGPALPVPVARLPNAGVYVPPPGLPGLSPAERKASRVAGGRLPAQYRFGWLSLPILALVTALAFAAPIESLYGMIYGFLLTVGISRIVLGIRWVREHGPAGFTSTAVRWLGRDLLGLAGLALAGYVALGVGEEISIPNISKDPIRLDWLTLQVSPAPAHRFTSASQVGPFLHALGTLPVLAVAAIVVLRLRADLRRPLVLPRLAGLLNRQPLRLRFGVAGALCLVAGMVIALTGGLSYTKAPSGAVCHIAPVSCAVAKSVHIGARPMSTGHYGTGHRNTADKTKRHKRRHRG